MKMSRKKKLAKQARKTTKTKLNFVKTICRKSCGLCDVVKKDVTGKKPADLFCYDYLYTAQPNVFLNNVLPKTQQLGFWAHNVEEPVPTIDEIHEFSSIFCTHGICKQADFIEKDVCANVEECIGLFRDFVLNDCGINEDIEPVQGNDDQSVSNWDGVSPDYWRQYADNKAKASANGKCKKRGKNKAKKKGSKAHRNKKPGKAYAQTEYDDWGKNRKVKNNHQDNWKIQAPKVTIFTNMTEEQLQHIYGDDENNDKKQNTLEAGAG